MLNLFIFLILFVVPSAIPCVPTISTPPIDNKESCCPINILDNTSEGHAVFDPELRDCPQQALFICSVSEPGSLLTTVITVNGNNKVFGKNGTNSRIALTCNFKIGQWMYHESNEVIIIDHVGCQNKIV